MKFMAVLLLLLGTPVLLRAQQTHDAEGPTDVAVVKCSWQKERLPGWENNPFGPTFETYEAMRARVDNERRIQQARNVGNKAEQGRRESAAKMLEDANRPKDTRKNERPRDGYRYKVQVRNNGPKTIRLIDWDYLFLDPNTQEEIARRQFTSEEKIRPGKDKELEVFILTPPVRVVKADASKKTGAAHIERVLIMRIEYSDGSVWQRP